MGDARDTDDALIPRADGSFYEERGAFRGEHAVRYDVVARVGEDHLQKRQISITRGRGTKGTEQGAQEGGRG